MYSLPAHVRTTLYLLTEAIEGVATRATENLLSPVCGRPGGYGVEDLTSDPYAYLDR